MTGRYLRRKLLMTCLFIDYWAGRYVGIPGICHFPITPHLFLTSKASNHMNKLGGEI